MVKSKFSLEWEMKQFAVSLAILTTSFGLLPEADARRCCYGYRVRYYRVHPNYHVVRRAPPPPRWALGLHLTGLSTDQMLDDEAVVLGGIGGHLRWRTYRWGAELAIDGLGAEFLDGRISRVSVPIQASGLLYVVPEGVFNLYLIGGMRVVPTVIRWNYPDLQTDQEFAEFGFHGGIGADLNLGYHFALTADLRFFGVVRADSEPAGSYYSDVEPAILPEKSTGMQFNLGVSFRF
jgi:hypothetical protein